MVIYILFIYNQLFLKVYIDWTDQLSVPSEVAKDSNAGEDHTDMDPEPGVAVGKTFPDTLNISSPAPSCEANPPIRDGKHILSAVFI